MATFLVGLPLVVLAIISLLQGGDGPGGSVAQRAQSQAQAPAGKVEYPEALSNLPGPARGLAFDQIGILSFVLIASDKPTLSRYDPATSALETFPLPGPPQESFYVASFELGRGPRAGKLLVGWQSELWEVDCATGQAAQLRLDPVRRIMDIAVGDDGTVWVSRDQYPYLIALNADGSQREFPLPEGAGSPGSLAIDGKGRVWATLWGHRPVLGATSGNLTLRFDPANEKTDVLEWQSWNVAGNGGEVVATGGAGPGTARQLDVEGDQPRALADFGPSFPGEEMAVGADGSIWYRSPPAGGIVRIAADGSQAVFPLPTYTGNLRDTGCDACPDEEFTTLGHVQGIAVAADGSAWFSTSNRIGHAIP